MNRLTDMLALAVPAALVSPVVAQDLNGDGTADSIELRLGTSQDCNLNGFIDASDLLPHVDHAIEHWNGLEGFQNNVWDALPIDFDQDGDRDLVVTSMVSTNVGGISFWRNDGGPGLVHVTRWDLPGTRPYSLDGGDFDGDGTRDFVAADSSFNRAYVYFGAGDGTFTGPTILQGPASTNGTTAVEAADLDLDGDLDVAFTSYNEELVSVFLNDGTGTFSAVATFPSGPQSRDVKAGDVTGDGLPDLAIAVSAEGANPIVNGWIAILAGDGAGGFVPEGTVPLPMGDPPFAGRARPRALALGDLDDDGDLDLVVSASSSNNLTVHLNDGAGTFAQTQRFGGFSLESDASDVILVDLDGDGQEDVVWGDRDMHSAAVYRNELGTLAFHQRYALGNYGPVSLAAADFTGDGLPELVGTNEGSRTFSLAVNRGALELAAPINLRPVRSATDPLLGDFTGDGITDLALTRQGMTGGLVVAVYPGLGGGVFSQTSIDTPISFSGRNHARDLDGDGNLDILNVYGHCYVMLGNGDGTFGPEIDSNLVVMVRHVILDIDADGDLDLAWLAPGHPSLLRVSRGDGTGGFGPYVEYVDVREDESIGFGDLDGDGAPEILTGHRYGVLSIHRNDGGGNFAQRDDLVLPDDPFTPIVNAIATADFDLDGDIDVAVTAYGLKLLFNPGDGQLTPTPVEVSESSGSTLRVADMDLDGTPDLVARNAGASIFLNPDGDGLFQAPMNVLRYDSTAHNIVLGDANNDGRTDFLLGPENSTCEFLYLNLPPVSLDLDGSGVPDECEEPSVTFCFGDGRDGVACPCGNAGGGDAGCDNAQGTGGVALGVTSLSRNGSGGGSVTLAASGYPTTGTPATVAIRGAQRALEPVPFGDGVRCVGQPITRVGVTTASGGSSAHVLTHGAGSGTFHYQIWYRNTPMGFCDAAAAFNLSQGVSITWL